ncbi:hypothetical protein ACIA5D_31755 [Actinoplanes sp. NPDC051513]|uniref:hypothetical protein n=1 Tax=Actinoplanes sp. NPDC051513 TaxID=3363908 RepID=UPI003799CF71
MTVQVDAVHAQQVSLSGHSLSDVRSDQSRELAQAVRLLLRQVERPRVNLGGSGPPGRAD